MNLGKVEQICSGTIEIADFGKKSTNKNKKLQRIILTAFTFFLVYGPDKICPQAAIL